MGSKTTYARRAAELRQAASPRGRARLGLFAIEGTRAFERALRADFPLAGALAAHGFGAGASPADERARALLAELELRGVPCERAPDALLEELCAGRDIGRIQGLARVPAPLRARELAALAAREAGRARILAIDAIREPGNVGALVRTALASGAAAACCVAPADPWHPKAVRTSMGSVFRLPIATYDRAGALLEDLAAAGFATLGASATGAGPLEAASVGWARVALFVGCEAAGLAPETLARLDRSVAIPMGAAVDSYSVNAAAAILLHELARKP